jgi:TRAP-type C4-dicarboxylate transport system permease small subunit
VDPADTLAAPVAADTPSRTPASSLDRLDWLLGAVFCLVVLLNFASAVARYAGATMFIGADEVQVYTMIWLVFLGAASAGRRGLHLRMDLLAQRLSGPAARWRQAFEAALTLVVCGTMAWLSVDFTRQMFGMAQRSDAAGIPMWMVHAAPAAGFLGLALAAAIELARVGRK